MSPSGADDDPAGDGSGPADESSAVDDPSRSRETLGGGETSDREVPPDEDGVTPPAHAGKPTTRESGDAESSVDGASGTGGRPVEPAVGSADDAGTVDGVGRRERASSDAETGAGGERGASWRTFAYDVGSSAGAVLVVGLLLFAVSGVWPPMVAVESPSMYPNMQTGDLVFVMDENRFPGEGAQAGVVTARVGTETGVDYRKFRRQGDVIVFEPNGDSDRTPIIHRAMFWVDENENWYGKADRQSIGRYDECGETTSEALPNCPAPHAGFITKGDNNGVYDQSQELSGPVKPAWVVGTAELRVPKLGCIRLRSERCANGLVGTTAPAASAAGDRPLAGSGVGGDRSQALSLVATSNATVSP